MSKTATTNTAPSAPAAASPQAAATSTTGAAAEAAAGGDAGGEEEPLTIPMDELGADEAALLASWKAEGTTTDGDTGTDAEAGDGTDDAAADDSGETPEEEDDAEADEAEGESETETGEENEGEEQEDDKAADKTPVQKRIDKLTGQKKALQEQLAAVTAENQQLKAGGPKPGQPIALVPMAEDPLSHLSSVEEVTAAMDAAKATIAWCKANKHGALVPKEPGSADKVELTADQIAEIRDQQEELLKEHAPGRLKWLDNYGTSHADALKSYPDLFKPGTKDQEFVKLMIQHVPGLARHPMHELFLGDMLVGANIRAGRMKVVRVNPPAAAAAPAPVQTPAKPAAAPSPAKPSLGSSAVAPAARPKGAKPDTSGHMAAALNGTMDPDDALQSMLSGKFG